MLGIPTGKYIALDFYKLQRSELEFCFSGWWQRRRVYFVLLTEVSLQSLHFLQHHWIERLKWATRGEVFPYQNPLPSLIRHKSKGILSMGGIQNKTKRKRQERWAKEFGWKRDLRRSKTPKFREAETISQHPKPLTIGRYLLRINYPHSPRMLSISSYPS